jgi:hypothetical protein
MTYLYRAKRLPATDTKPTRFNVTRVLTGKSRIVPLDHSAIVPAQQAILDAFGGGSVTANLQFAGADKQTVFYISSPL